METSQVLGFILLGVGIVILTWAFGKKKGDKMENTPKYEVFKDKKKGFRFRLIAPNGEIICQSEGYETKQACIDTIAVLGDYAKIARTVDLTE